MQGGYVSSSAEGGEGRVYVRVLKDQNAADEGAVARILDLLDEVLHKLAVRVSVDRQPAADSPNAAFLEKLREQPSCHFLDGALQEP